MIRSGAMLRFLLPLAIIAAAAGCDRGMGRPTPPRWCTPTCEGRECGEDGCGGICGTCQGAQSCSVFTGECLAGGAGTVFGYLNLEVRLGGVEDGDVYLDPPLSLPAFGANATVVDGDGAVIGARQLTSRDGGFEIPVSRELDGDERLVISTMWAPTGEILMAVLRPEYRPGADHYLEYDTWLWTWDIPVTPGSAMDVTIREADGSGALYLYLLSQTAMETILADLAKDDTSKVARLALIWAPGLTLVCGTCYADDMLNHRIEGSESVLNRAIFIDGKPGGSSAWGWPAVFHEMGHYVAFQHSRDNSPGGPHSIGQLLHPAFAWSEGWASFFGAMTATRWFGEPMSVYWDVQGGSAFWIDLQKRIRYDGASIGMPKASKGIAQALDEFFVSSALWHLWDGSDSLEDGSGTLSTSELLLALGSQRFITSDRGATGSDLVDFLDAAACLYPSDKAWKSGVGDDARDGAAFPYDGKPDCKLYSNSAPQSPIDVSLDGSVDTAGRTTVHARLSAFGVVDEPIALRLELPDGARVVAGQMPEHVAMRDLLESGGLTFNLDIVGTAGRPVRLVAEARGRDIGLHASARWPQATAPMVSTPAVRTLTVPFHLGPVTVTRSITVNPD